MRQTCLDMVYELAKQDERVVFVGSDLGPGTLDGFKREAIVQFPPPLRPNGRPDTEKQFVNPDHIRNAVTAVIEAGWNPTSRGKPMVFDVDADGR